MACQRLLTFGRWGHNLNKKAFVWGGFIGTYLSPGNEWFRKILQSEYLDKTGLIALINQTIGTMGMLTCISRPRRFGKSYAAKMLCAYYDCSCDSRGL
nr:AAA family ATPase [uncultured Acetatifactor sp.]